MWSAQLFPETGRSSCSTHTFYLAFLYSETDENDSTYFIVHQLDVIKKAIKNLHAYISRKSAEFKESEKFLRDWASLNHRQQALLSHALRHPDMTYTVEAHQRSHGTVYETARRDLLKLVEAGLFLKSKRGRTMVFRARPDFSARLKRGPDIRQESVLAIQAKQASISLSAFGVRRTGFMNPRSAAAVSHSSKRHRRQPAPRIACLQVVTAIASVRASSSGLRE
jgi:hypothetical protein